MLQAKARAAKDAKELSQIIEEMNRLLSAYEKSAGYEEDGDQPASQDEDDEEPPIKCSLDLPKR